MRPRLAFLSVIVGLVCWVLATPALAGGWAVTTFDDVPAAIRAGETYRLGYTIRQHGRTPYSEAKTAIRIRSTASGELHVFGGTPEGAAGHYVAEVRFPAAGEWTWEVTQGPFQPQSLGAITVAPAPASVEAAAPPAAVAESRGTTLAVLSFALPLATLLAFGLFAHRLVIFARRRQAVSGPRSAALVGGAE